MKTSKAFMVGMATCLALGAHARAQDDDGLPGEKGVVLVPRNFPNHSPADVEGMFTRARELGSFAIIKVKWSEKEHFTVASTIVRLAQNAGLTPVVELSAIESKGGQSARVVIPDEVQRAGGKASFANPAVVDAFVATAGGMAELRPPYLALGTDVNLLAASDRREFDAFARAYRLAYAAVKRASPQTRVFVTFAWDAMAQQDERRRAAELIDAFRPDLDVLALGSDPTDLYSKVGPSSVPASYYDGIRRLRQPGDRLLLEVSWRAEGKRGPEQQVEFIRSLPRRVAKAGPEMLAWNFLHDVKVMVFTVGLGLLQRDGTPKPAFRAFADLSGRHGNAAAVVLPGAMEDGDGNGDVTTRLKERASRRLAIKKIGDRARGGIFDPSFSSDGSKRIWISYSAVQPSPEFGSRFNSVSTHLAYSDDGGDEWQESSTVNPSTEADAPRSHRGLAAKWEHEVSRIVYDPYASAKTRWKLLWHRYLRVYDGKSPDSTPLFEHGWMELRTASDPQGPWSEGRKLFAGAGYSKSDDENGGKPEMRLDKLFPGKKGMGRCAAFTEPGMVAREEGIYVVMRCATGKPDGLIVELRCDHEFGSCDYRGALLEDAQAAPFGYGFTGFSGTDLIEKDGDAYLIATPTRQPGESYHGCLLFKVDSLEDARLKQENGKPAVALEVKAEGPVFNGACGYPGARSKSGVFLSQFSDGDPDHFQIFRSGKHPR